MENVVNPVSNPALKEAIAKAKEDACMENSVRLLNEVVKAKLLAPVLLNRGPEYDSELDEIVLEKDTQISFELIQANNADLYYPVFTDGPEMKKCGVDRGQHSLVVNFDDLAAMLLQPQNAVAGFVINPMSHNICFTTEMVAAIKKDMEKENKEKEKKEDGE